MSLIPSIYPSTSLVVGGRRLVMKKLLGILVLGLLWCNVGVAEDISRCPIIPKSGQMLDVGKDVIGFKFLGESYLKVRSDRNEYATKDGSGIIGCYKRIPIENGWHTGSIYFDGKQLKWKNASGVSWNLKADFKNKKLITGEDNPYADYEHPHITLLYQGDITLPCLVNDIKIVNSNSVPNFKLTKNNVPTVQKPWNKQNNKFKKDCEIVYDKKLIEALLTHPNAVKAHPGAEFTPGFPRKGARSVSGYVEINKLLSDGRANWISTGLYASAGQKIIITVPNDLLKLGLRIQIGAHIEGDHAYSMNSIRRFPYITHSWPLNSNKIVSNSAFGGLIYIIVPGGNLSLDKASTLSIKGAFLAPRYIHGKTTMSDWKNKIRQYPAPWAELESDKVILTVPSRTIRDLDNPDELMKFWNRAMDAAADLASISRVRTRAERYVIDPNWDWGAHSGYPIMMAGTWHPYLLKHHEIGLNYWWGTFHELGHNHQMSEWIWKGWTEVTCNIWPVYILENIAGIKREETWDGKTLHYKRRVKRIKKFINAGRPFTMLQNDPAMALEHLLQLQEAFGWEIFMKLNAKYRDLPYNKKPKSDNEKIQHFIVNTSNITKTNLINFYEDWGFPIDDNTIKALSALPKWKNNPMK